MTERRVNRLEVLANDLRPALLEGLRHRLAHERDRVVLRHDAAQREEARLHDRADAPVEPDVVRDAKRVDDEESEPFVDDFSLHVARERAPRALRRVRRVQEKRRAGRGAPEHVDPLEELRLGARHEPRALHEVRRADRPLRDAQVRDRHRPRFLRVVDEVALHPAIGVLADDLDRLLALPDRAVGAEAEEHGARDLVGLDVERRVERERAVGDVVDDPDREVVAGFGRAELVEDRAHHRGREFLAREAVAAADDDGDVAARLAQRRDDVEVERIADGARLLRAVEHGERAHARGERPRERGHVEWPVEPDLEHAHALAARAEPVGGLLRRLRARAHEDDDALRVGRAGVVEEAVAPPGARRERVHRFLNEPRARVVERVARFARLKERVRVLRRAAHHRMIGRERAPPMRGDGVLVEQRAQVVVGERRDLADLVRRAEPVEEMQERHARAERRGVRDGGEIVRLLHRARREHREARLPARHHVRVIPEDRERVRRERARRDVHHERRELARDFVHVGDHEQQPLRRREGRRERAGLDGAVDRAGRAGLRLHLHHARRLTPDVRLPGRRPLVGELAHQGRRRDRVDRDHLAEAVRDGGDGLVSVEGEERHGVSPSTVRATSQAFHLPGETRAARAPTAPARRKFSAACAWCACRSNSSASDATTRARGRRWRTRTPCR